MKTKNILGTFLFLIAQLCSTNSTLTNEFETKVVKLYNMDGENPVVAEISTHANLQERYPILCKAIVEQCHLDELRTIIKIVEPNNYVLCQPSRTCRLDHAQSKLVYKTKQLEAGAFQVVIPNGKLEFILYFFSTPDSENLPQIIQQSRTMLDLVRLSRLPIQLIYPHPAHCYLKSTWLGHMFSIAHLSELWDFSCQNQFACYGDVCDFIRSRGFNLIHVPSNRLDIDLDKIERDTPLSEMNVEVSKAYWINQVPVNNLVEGLFNLEVPIGNFVLQFQVPHRYHDDYEQIFQEINNTETIYDLCHLSMFPIKLYPNEEIGCSIWNIQSADDLEAICCFLTKNPEADLDAMYKLIEVAGFINL